MSNESECRERDAHRCFRCAEGVAGRMSSLHHRKLRSGGGSNGPENRITLCGSGTTGCHGWVHAHPREARVAGWIVSRYAEPADVPVWKEGTGWVMLGTQYEVTEWRGEPGGQPGNGHGPGAGSPREAG